MNVPDLPGHTQTPGVGLGDPTSTEGPALRPRQPTTARTGTTEPPFIGDEYMSDEIPPQTVSLLVDRVHLRNTGTCGALCNVSGTKRLLFIVLITFTQSVRSVSILSREIKRMKKTVDYGRRGVYADPPL